MLAYSIVRYLQKAWKDFDLTVEEGIKLLSSLPTLENQTNNEVLLIPKPRKQSQDLLAALDIDMPEALPRRDVRVVTRKKLTSERKK